MRSFGKIAFALGGAAVGVLVLDQILKSSAPAAAVWTPIPALSDTVIGRWYRWSIVTTATLAHAQAIFAPDFGSLKAWPTVSMPLDWPASDQGTNRLRFQGQAIKIVAGLPAQWQPALFELSSGSPS